MSELNEILKAWRHELHRHPETAFEETRTAAFVAERLREMGIEVHTGIGGTGVIGRLKVGDGHKVGPAGGYGCDCAHRDGNRVLQIRI